MGKFGNIYPRGVVIDWETSPTIILTPLPEKARPNAVFWLNKNGIIYESLLSAIANTNKIPPAYIGRSSFTPTLDHVFAAGEKAFYHTRLKGKSAVYKGEMEDSRVYKNYYRVKTIDVPYALTVSTKPGDHSTIWISKNDRAYATRKLALEDNITKSIPFDAVISKVSSISSFFKSSWLWLLLVCITFYLIYKKYGKQLKSPGSRAAVPALPE
ncbi:MAG: hypothetical protein LBF69_00850 [Prevotellaceae bacterium]|jgi:hypothetical protein|nr:hypothetical protein [Prevotellaceae bacterium]